MIKANTKGLLLVISGPSGVGKGTICQLFSRRSADVTISISATTRTPRPGEIDGVHYHFLTKDDFVQRIAQGDFLEWAEVYGNYYGTPRWAVEEALAQGQNVLLEIDTQGAMKVKTSYPDGTFIFILPPSREELEQRLRNRGTETESKICLRLAQLDAEMSRLPGYDYVVINDTVPAAAEKIEAIVQAEKCKLKRFITLGRE